MRQTQRLTARNGALLVVDLQDKLLAAIADRERVVANVVHLIQGAKALGLPDAAVQMLLTVRAE